MAVLTDTVDPWQEQAGSIPALVGSAMPRSSFERLFHPGHVSQAFAHSLHLDDAPLRDLPFPRPAPLNLLRGVEGVVGMAGTLVGPSRTQNTFGLSVRPTAPIRLASAG